MGPRIGTFRFVGLLHAQSHPNLCAGSSVARLHFWQRIVVHAAEPGVTSGMGSATYSL